MLSIPVDFPGFVGATATIILALEMLCLALFDNKDTFSPFRPCIQ